jgi:hypothetical protein
MRRFLTLVCLLGLALPAGISISGCIRNPAGNYCNGLGYGLKDTDVASITLQPQLAGISLAYGQTTQISSPTAYDCKGTTAAVGGGLYSYATTNNQLVDISPGGDICAGTWNRNTGGGISDYTYCYYPSPAPSTDGLPYGVAYITATAASVTSNPVAVYVHAPITAINLVTQPLSSTSSSTSQQCYSQNKQAELDAEACYEAVNGSGVLTQYEFCAPSSVTSNFACANLATSPNILASGSFTAPSAGASGAITGALYLSGGSISGTSGQTCKVSGFNSGSGATATLQLTGTNTVAAGTALIMISDGSGASAPPTTATLSSGTATCSGTIQLGQIYGSVGDYCYLSNFNNGASGATAKVTLTGANTIAAATPISVTAGGSGATQAPTLALMTSGTASCAGEATVSTRLTPVPSCGSSIGTLNFGTSNSTVATISSGTLSNPLSTITALQPGTTTITATLAQSSSLAGTFSTCPPASIKVSLTGGATSGVVTQGYTQDLTTSVTDTAGNPISGMSLSYESTNPIDVTAASGGAITANYPGVASIYAVCEPSSCNPAPIDEFGLYGTGLPLTSNSVTVTVPGATSNYVWFGAPGQSQYFASIEMLTGNPGATVRLPYVPNSMVMDQLANNLYFGSSRELMVYSTASNSITAQNTTVPGVVLAASPNASQLLINDQVRGMFYLYSVSSGSATTYGGMGVAASWTPDSNTLYIVDSAAANNLPQNVAAGITSHTDTLYVYNANTGWSTYDLSAIGGAESLAITVPSVGAYLSGSLATVAHAWCPTGTVGVSSSISYYPQTDDVSLPPAGVLAATSDGAHILGASSSGSSIALADIGVTIPTAVCKGVGTSAPANGASLQTISTGATIINQNVNLNAGTGVSVSAVDQIVTGMSPTTASTSTAVPIAFVTYNTSSSVAAQLPFYLPKSSSTGLTGYVTFADSSSATPPTAPLAGAFSPDNSIFFVSTAGDNEVHLINIPANLSTTAPPAENIQLYPPYSPKLPACTPVSLGGDDAGCLYKTSTVPSSTTYVPATVIAVKPRSVT